MRRIFYLLTAFALLFLVGCSTTLPGGIEDSTSPVTQNFGYTILGESEGTSSSTFFMGLQLSQADMDVAIQEAVNKLGGDELINVTWYNTFTNYYLFTTYKFTVKGTVIKRAEWKSSDESEPLSSQQPVGIRPHPQDSKEAKGNNISLGFIGGYKGTLNGDYYNDAKIDGYKGWSLLYRMRKPDRLTYLSPYIGFSNFTKKLDYSEYYQEYFELELSETAFVRTLSLGANYGVNFSKMREMPTGLNPYAEGGFGLAWVSQGSGDGFLQLGDGSSTWHWLRLGLNAGVGTEYYLNEDTALDFFLSYHHNFFDLGVTTTTGDEGFGDYFYEGDSGKEKLTDHYFRFGFGLTFK